MKQKCCVKNCTNSADYKVYLYDCYQDIKEIFVEQDETCGFLCSEHMIENEQSCRGERKPRGYCEYKYSNKRVSHGFTIYLPIDFKK
jgi:hypothetical protein